jgi:hypothetical protein
LLPLRRPAGITSRCTTRAITVAEDPKTVDAGPVHLDGSGGIDIRAELSRIDRERAETQKLMAEQQKLCAEQFKFGAEQVKRYAEAFKQAPCALADGGHSRRQRWRHHNRSCPDPAEDGRDPALTQNYGGRRKWITPPERPLTTLTS